MGKKLRESEVNMEGYIGEERNKEKKRFVRAGYALAWVAMILTWIVLASQSLGIVG